MFNSLSKSYQEPPDNSGIAGRSDEVGEWPFIVFVGALVLVILLRSALL